MEDQPARNPLMRFANALFYVLDAPVTFFREKIVEPNHQHYAYYHQKFRRVPTFDECYTDDPVCHFEANQQFYRDKLVDNQILSILRQRYEHCNDEDPNQRGEEKCEAIYEIYEQNAANWFEKYGDQGPVTDVRQAFFKQKHRMVWERRHGKVGSGMKKNDYKIEEDPFEAQ